MANETFVELKWVDDKHVVFINGEKAFATSSSLCGPTIQIHHRAGDGSRVVRDGEEVSWSGSFWEEQEHLNAIGRLADITHAPQAATTRITVGGMPYELRLRVNGSVASWSIRPHPSSLTSFAKKTGSDYKWAPIQHPRTVPLSEQELPPHPSRLNRINRT